MSRFDDEAGWQSNEKRPMIHVVLGMHKSGTTLVSRMLHASGINMGEDIDTSLDYDEGGHCERRATADINHALLRCCLSGPTGTGHYHSLSRIRVLPTSVQPDAEARMREVIAACSRAHAEWGFKDPRTCLTYPLWRPYLGEHKVIGVYRGIGEVLQHYGVAGVRQAWLPRAYRVLQTWVRYNELLIEACENPHVPTLVIRYERLLDDERELGHVSAFLQRPIRDVREPGRYRSQTHDRPHPLSASLLAPFVPTHPRDVLCRLEELRRESLARVGSFTAHAAPGRLTASIEDS